MKTLSPLFALILAGVLHLDAQTGMIVKKQGHARAVHELDSLELPERYMVLPVREDLPPRIKKLIRIYLRKGIALLAEESDVKREEEYLSHYRDKTYVKYMLVNNLRSIVGENVEGLARAQEGGRSFEEIKEFEANVLKLKGRLAIAEKWKP